MHCLTLSFNPVPQGRVLVTKTAGACGFKNTRKSTAHAGQVCGMTLGLAMRNEFGLSKARLAISGIGKGRQTALRGIQAAGIDVVSVTDVTRKPLSICTSFSIDSLSH